MDRDAREIGEAAQGVSGDGEAPFVQLVSGLSEAKVADEFVEHDALSEEGADEFAVIPRDAHEPYQRRMNPAEDGLERFGFLGAKPCQRARKESIGEGDDGHKSDDHGHDVDGEFHSVGSPPTKRIQTVDRFDLGRLGRAGFGGAHLLFGEHDFGHQDRCRSTDDRRREEMARWHTQHDVGGQHASRDRCHSARHQGEKFAACHRREVGFDHHRGFGLTHENVGGGGQTFAATDIHQPAHDPGHGTDRHLQDSVVVEQ